ncbi:hypothetical protein M9H77_18032 [Catharanthus roseus]|uniref:Uncharacterized protein n=1 Tax=Catharanthus roseus TaxID=4058 RepID=A0ACC0B6B1_CATRO|nr:hypothetical protein M9H77_18032 [Catharanthus roseus]
MGEQPMVQQHMGSGSPIDDLVESGTVRLLDWNDSMTDIQLGMRFVDKVQFCDCRVGIKSQGLNPNRSSVKISASPMWEVVLCAHKILGLQYAEMLSNHELYLLPEHRVV